MLTDVPSADRARLAPLFNGFPGLHGCLHAVFEGAMGTAQADDLARPSVALLGGLDFYFLAGDPDAPAAEEAARSFALPASVATSSPVWEPLLRRVWGPAFGTHTRVAFQPGAWERARLRGFVDALPPDFVLKPITIADAARFRELADSLVFNFVSLDDFIARGAGYGVEHDGRFVSGCSSFAISSHSLEFEIQTHPDFRERDLATAAASAMIEHCVDRGLEPCWDAHNEISTKLATKLGFVNPAPYTSYYIAKEAT